MTEINVEIRHSSLVIKKGSDWVYAHTGSYKDERVEMGTNGRIIVEDSDGRFKAMVWVGRNSNVRQKLIKARQNGHNVLVDV